jgi:hypothetical protein
MAVGIRGGVNFANMVAQAEFMGQSASESTPRRIEFTVGAFFSRELTERFGVQVEALVSGRGAGGEGGVDGIGVRYLDIPVLVVLPVARSADGVGLDVLAGATFGVRLTGADPIPVPGLPPIDGDDFIARLDTALTVGLAITRGAFVVDVRYLHGLTNQFTDAALAFLRDILEEPGIDLAIKHRVVALTVGWRF